MMGSDKDREWRVRIWGNDYTVVAPTYWKVKWKGCLRYKREHPHTKRTVSEWCHSPSVKVRVVEDRRVKV